jgi:hypothetical protein
VRVQALAVTLWAVPVARPADLPVPGAVWQAAGRAEPGIVVQPGGMNPRVAVRQAERRGQPVRLFGRDRITAAVPGRDPLEQQLPPGRIPVPAE